MNYRDKLVDVINSYFGVDAAYYGIDPYHFADYLIKNGVTLG